MSHGPLPCQAEPVAGRAGTSMDMTSTAVLLTQAMAAHRAGRIDEAVQFARESPYPRPEEALEQVFV